MGRRAGPAGGDRDPPLGTDPATLRCHHTRPSTPDDAYRPQAQQQAVCHPPRSVSLRLGWRLVRHHASHEVAQQAGVGQVRHGPVPPSGLDASDALVPALTHARDATRGSMYRSCDAVAHSRTPRREHGAFLCHTRSRSGICVPARHLLKACCAVRCTPLITPLPPTPPLDVAC